MGFIWVTGTQDVEGIGWGRMGVTVGGVRGFDNEVPSGADGNRPPGGDTVAADTGTLEYECIAGREAVYGHNQEIQSVNNRVKSIEETKRY